MLLGGAEHEIRYVGITCQCIVWFFFGDIHGSHQSIWRKIMAIIQCPECQAEISSKAPSCPRCGLQLAAKDQQKSAAELVDSFGRLAARVDKKIIVAVVLLASIACCDMCIGCAKDIAKESSVTQLTESNQNANGSDASGQKAITPQRADSNVAETPASATGETVKSPMPEPRPARQLNQRDLNQIVSRLASAYNAAPNELKKSSLRADRKSMLLAMFSDSLAVTDWTGKIAYLSTVSDGSAHLTIKSDSFSVKTDSNTEITPGTPLYTALMQLGDGVSVVYSGEFRPGNRDYIDEGSFTEEGAMTEPEFTMRFTAIRAK